MSSPTRRRATRATRPIPQVLGTRAGGRRDERRCTGPGGEGAAGGLGSAGPGHHRAIVCFVDDNKHLDPAVAGAARVVAARRETGHRSGGDGPGRGVELPAGRPGQDRAAAGGRRSGVAGIPVRQFIRLPERGGGGAARRLQPPAALRRRLLHHAGLACLLPGGIHGRQRRLRQRRRYPAADPGDRRRLRLGVPGDRRTSARRGTGRRRWSGGQPRSRSC